MKRMTLHRCVLLLLCCAGIFAADTVGCKLFHERAAIEEVDSREHILALNLEHCGYIIRDDFANAYSRNGERKASIGTAENGMFFDGEAAYRYLDGEGRRPWRIFLSQRSRSGSTCI